TQRLTPRRRTCATRSAPALLRLLIRHCKNPRAPRAPRTTSLVLARMKEVGPIICGEPMGISRLSPARPVLNPPSVQPGSGLVQQDRNGMVDRADAAQAPFQAGGPKSIDSSPRVQLAGDRGAVRLVTVDNHYQLWRQRKRDKGTQSRRIAN